jgi:hypothetical protein
MKVMVVKVLFVVTLANTTLQPQVRIEALTIAFLLFHWKTFKQWLEHSTILQRVQFNIHLISLVQPISVYLQAKVRAFMRGQGIENGQRYAFTVKANLIFDRCKGKNKI